MRFVNFLVPEKDVYTNWKSSKWKFKFFKIKLTLVIKKKEEENLVAQKFFTGQ